MNDMNAMTGVYEIKTRNIGLAVKNPKFRCKRYLVEKKKKNRRLINFRNRKKDAWMVSRWFPTLNWDAQTRIRMRMRKNEKKQSDEKEERRVMLQKASSGEWEGFRLTLTTTGFDGAGSGAGEEELSAMLGFWLGCK